MIFFYIFKGETALHIAFSDNNTNAVEILCQNGASLTQRNIEVRIFLSITFLIDLESMNRIESRISNC